MENNKKWIKKISIMFIVIIIINATVAYLVDPFFQYRIREDTYMLNPTYSAPGLIKNYDYDTIIIGSSMTQNFDMKLFRKKKDCEPLHIGIGGMNTADLIQYINLAGKVGKAKQYYICIDIGNFTNEEDGKAISYLVENDIISKMRYVFSYESWFRFMPVDLALVVVKKMGYSMPDQYKYRTNIEYLGYWGHQYQYDEKVVLENYVEGVASVSEVDVIPNLYEEMIGRIESFFSDIDFESGNFIFFFPPYSVLFWYDANEKGYMDEYLDAKKYFIEKACSIGCEVYDFQGEEFTRDLNNYKDTTHYSPLISDEMIGCFEKKINIINQIDSITIENEKIYSNLKDFERKYGVCLNKEFDKLH